MELGKQIKLNPSFFLIFSQSISKYILFIKPHYLLWQCSCWFFFFFLYSCSLKKKLHWLGHHSFMNIEIPWWICICDSLNSLYYHLNCSCSLAKEISHRKELERILSTIYFIIPNCYVVVKRLNTKTFNTWHCLLEVFWI